MLLDFSRTLVFILTLLIFIWLGALTFLLARILKTFNRLTQGTSDKDLKEVLEEVLEEIKKNQKLGEELKEATEQLKAEDLGHFQKVGLIRYNPFSETGGNQSFVLALLDGQNSGFVITSLHSREATRVFAKPVKEGKEAGFEFSKEEIQAIVIAQKKEKVIKKQ